MKTMRLYFTLFFSLIVILSNAQTKSKRLNRKLAKIRTEATKLDSSLIQFDTLTFELDTISIQVKFTKELYVFSCAGIVRDTNYSFEIRVYGIDESTKYYKANYRSMKYSDLQMMHEVFVKDDEVLFEWWLSKVRPCMPISNNLDTGLFYDYPILLEYQQLVKLKNLTVKKIKTGYNN
jgi:hypothetical protein